MTTNLDQNQSVRLPAAYVVIRPTLGLMWRVDSKRHDYGQEESI